MTPHQIGSLFRAMRKSRKLTQQEVANRSGLSRSTVASVEDAIRSTDVDTLLAMAKGLDCEVTIELKKKS